MGVGIRFDLFANFRKQNRSFSKVKRIIILGEGLYQSFILIFKIFNLI